jgi:hypothetical protein
VIDRRGACRDAYRLFARRRASESNIAFPPPLRFLEPFAQCRVGRRVHPLVEDAEGSSDTMYSIFYLIGVVVVVLAILSLLGLA